MAGSAPPALAAEVRNAGGLGPLGCGSMTLDGPMLNTEEIRAAANRRFNLNFFAHDAPKDNPGIDAVPRRRAARFYEESSLGEVPLAGQVPFDRISADALSVLLDTRPAVVSFHFGHPGSIWLGQ